MTTHPVNEDFDLPQEALANYAATLTYAALPDNVIHAAKSCLIDTIGVLLGGFLGEPCRLARNLAARTPTTTGATVFGTRIITIPEMAAFANGTAARFLEYNDVYHFPGSAHGHPSDVIAPIFAAGEYARVSGRDLITGIVLGYEIYGHVSDQFKNMAFDNANFCSMAASLAAGKMLGLTKTQLAHCVAMAVVLNNVLRQVRVDSFTMWKELAAGHAGRSAVFAALMASEGMEGPYKPFEGKAGWSRNIGGGAYAFDGLGKDYKILHARNRFRPAMGETHAAIFAAEKIGALTRLNDVKSVTVEVYKRARDLVGSGKAFWNPPTRETADHSLPYVVAAVLMDGALTPRSFHDDRLWSPELRGLLAKIEVVENPEFTEAYGRVPRVQRARVSVTMQNGEQIVGESGGGGQDLAVAKGEAEVIAKFRGMAEGLLGSKRVDKLLEQLWHLEELNDIAGLPGQLVLA